jgi:hypothetical protein
MPKSETMALMMALRPAAMALTMAMMQLPIVLKMDLIWGDVSRGHGGRGERSVDVRRRRRHPWLLVWCGIECCGDVDVVAVERARLGSRLVLVCKVCWLWNEVQTNGSALAL